MEGTAHWVQSAQSVMDYGVLTSMVAELMHYHEVLTDECQAEERVVKADWTSPSGDTQVRRHGSSASVQSLLIQVPDAIRAEYEVIYQGRKVFSWREYLWPHLQVDAHGDTAMPQLILPTACLAELMQFHQLHATQWLSRFENAQVHTHDVSSVSPDAAPAGVDDGNETLITGKDPVERQHKLSIRISPAGPADMPSGRHGQFVQINEVGVVAQPDGFQLL